MISYIGTNARRFTTDEILSAGKKQLVDVPTYQVYLCLAYLLLHNFLRRIGRLGYVISDDVATNLPASLDAAWNSLPER